MAPSSQLEHLLGARGEAELARGKLCARAADPHHVAHSLEGDPQIVEHAGGHPLLGAQQPQQEMLAPDVVVLKQACLVLGEHHHLAGRRGEALEHSRPNLAAAIRIESRLGASA